jgi:cell division protein FtsI/penicillin-binding protein 2
MSRNQVVLALFVVAFSALLLRIFFLNRQQKNRYESLGIPLVERGAIYDRKGRILALQVQTFTISLWLPDLRSRLEDESDDQWQKRSRGHYLMGYRFYEGP